MNKISKHSSTSHLVGLNPCGEILQSSPPSNYYRAIGSDGLSSYDRDKSKLSNKKAKKIADEMNKRLEDAIKKEREYEVKRSEFVDKLLEVGWIVNYGYIQKLKKEKADQRRESYDENDIDMEVMVSGKYLGDYHLISPCNNFTVRVKSYDVIFWQKNPEWKQLTDQKIEKIQFTDKGIKVGILRIELEDV
ncbi:MAG: hypothetical protein K0R18_235 [Bacillales bacterium]|jgi:hypothetical protein|nr:hypothetical protein [Bacillales bacterium]